MIERPVTGFEDIAAAAKCSARQVLFFATRLRDPLRLESYLDVPRILPSKLKAWRQRNADVAGLPKVRGWHAIAQYAEMSRMAAIRLAGIREDPLPVMQPKNGMVWAYASALDDWKEAHVLPYAAHRVMRKPRKWRAKGQGATSEPIAAAAE